MGYRRGQLIGKVDNYRHTIELASGKIIWLYDDEFERD